MKTKIVAKSCFYGNVCYKSATLNVSIRVNSLYEILKCIPKGKNVRLEDVVFRKELLAETSAVDLLVVCDKLSEFGMDFYCRNEEKIMQFLLGKIHSLLLNYHLVDRISVKSENIIESSVEEMIKDKEKVLKCAQCMREVLSSSDFEMLLERLNVKQYAVALEKEKKRNNSQMADVENENKKQKASTSKLKSKLNGKKTPETGLRSVKGFFKKSSS